MRKIAIHGGTLEVEVLETTNELALVIATPSDAEGPYVALRVILGRLEVSRLLGAIGEALISMGIPTTAEIVAHDEKRVVDPEGA